MNSLKWNIYICTSAIFNIVKESEKEIKTLEDLEEIFFTNFPTNFDPTCKFQGRENASHGKTQT